MLRKNNDDKLEHTYKLRNGQIRLHSNKKSTFSHLDINTIENECKLQKSTY